MDMSGPVDGDVVSSPQPASARSAMTRRARTA
jgi:hypothetical protein